MFGIMTHIGDNTNILKIMQSNEAIRIEAEVEIEIEG